MIVIAKFATTLRADSLIEHLRKENISTAGMTRPKWTNKKMPPPKVEVYVSEEQAAEACEHLARFNIGLLPGERV